MTEARKELREAVIKLYADKWGITDAGLADAAIALVGERMARVAEEYVINENELHPDVPFEQISQQYKNTVHAGAQYIAAAIRSLTQGE